MEDLRKKSFMNDPFFVAYHMDNPHQKHVRDSIRKRLSKADIEDHGGELETDVPTEHQLWEHDSFYRDTKSLLNLFQLMGVMPIERSGLGKTDISFIPENFK